MKKVTLATLTLVASFVILQACGTIIHGTTQEIGISSNPSKATVTVDGQEKGTTPMVVDFKRKDTHMVQIELDGYETYETTLTRKVSGWVWGNIVFGGLVGLAVDAISGGLYKLNPDQIEAELINGQMGVMESDEGLFITVVLKPEPNWEKVGSLNAVNSK